MKITNIVTIPFWGSRNYVHSSQLLDFLQKMLYENNLCPNSISLKILTPITTSIQFSISDLKPVNPVNALCQVKTKDSKDFYITIGEEGSPITKRTHDDEEEFTQNGYVNKESRIAEVLCHNPEHFFATMIALNKKLVIAVTDKEKKWLVAQVDITANFQKLPSANAKITVKNKNVLGDVLVRSEVFVNDVYYGMTSFKRV